MSVTLRGLREASGKSLGDILAEVRRIAPQIAPVARSGIIHWEKQGIRNIEVIRALAHVYDCPLETVEMAALSAANQFKRHRQMQENSLISHSPLDTA